MSLEGTIPASPRKEYAFTPTVSLDRVKAIKNALLGTTINDVLLAMLTLTIRRYFVELAATEIGDDGAEPETEVPSATTAMKGEKGRSGPSRQAVLEARRALRDHDMKGVFPVNVRRPGVPVIDPKDRHVGNNIVVCGFNFPIEESDPLRLVWRIKDQIDQVKVSPAVPIKRVMTKLAFHFFPRPLLRNAMERLTRAATATLSNVPGPQHPVSFMGMRVTDMRFYALSPLPTYLGIVSFDGKVNCGIVCDEQVSGKPKELAKHWLPALEEIERALAASGATAESPQSAPDLHPALSAVDRAFIPLAVVLVMPLMLPMRPLVMAVMLAFVVYRYVLGK